MTLEDVKDYAGYNNTNLNNYTELTDEGKEVIKWLIAEVEKAKQVHDVLITATATECAVISGQTSKVAEHRIKLRFGL